MTLPALMTLADLVRESGISRSSWERRPELLKRLKAAAPMGRRKYSRVLFERWMGNQSLTRIGRGARTA